MELLLPARILGILKEDQRRNMERLKAMAEEGKILEDRTREDLTELKADMR
jgi:hypothetical protein